MRNPSIEAYAKVKSLLNYMEIHEDLSYEKAKQIIEGVDSIWTRLERRKGARHPEDKS